MNPHHAQLPCWMFRLVSRRPAAPASSLSHTRTEVCPPEMWPSSLSWRGRFQRLASRWVGRASPWLPEPARPVNRLALVKAEFQESLADLADLADPRTQTVLDQIARARSLRELWHLRSPVYGAVALAMTQNEAEQRLARLNRHFPVRAPRAGLVASE